MIDVSSLYQLHTMTITTTNAYSGPYQTSTVAILRQQLTTKSHWLCPQKKS